MSHSTFNRLRSNLSQRFGNNIMETWSEPDTLTNGQKNKQIANYHANGYRSIPSENWISATLNDKPIVAILAYNGYNEIDVVIYTRNE